MNHVSGFCSVNMLDHEPTFIESFIIAAARRQWLPHGEWPRWHQLNTSLYVHIIWEVATLVSYEANSERVWRRGTYYKCYCEYDLVKGLEKKVV